MIGSLLATCVLAVWVIAIAIISVQNFTPISIYFLGFRSIQIPFGICLAFSVALGMVGMTLVQIVWRLASATQTSYSADTEFDDEY